LIKKCIRYNPEIKRTFKALLNFDLFIIHPNEGLIERSFSKNL
jgi:hypothetical protein